MDNSAADLLDIIKRNADLTVPELVARAGADASSIANDLTQLHSLGLVNLDQPDALVELLGFAEDITRRMEGRPTLEKRVELLRRTSRQGSLSRHTVLTPK